MSVTGNLIGVELGLIISSGVRVEEVLSNLFVVAVAGDNVDVVEDITVHVGENFNDTQAGRKFGVLVAESFVMNGYPPVFTFASVVELDEKVAEAPDDLSGGFHVVGQGFLPVSNNLVENVFGNFDLLIGKEFRNGGGKCFLGFKVAFNIIQFVGCRDKAENVIIGRLSVAGNFISKEVSLLANCSSLRGVELRVDFIQTLGGFAVNFFSFAKLLVGVEAVVFSAFFNERVHLVESLAFRDKGGNVFVMKLVKSDFRSVCRFDFGVASRCEFNFTVVCVSVKLAVSPVTG